MRSAIAVLALAASLVEGGLINRSTIEQCLASKGVPYDRRGTADWERDAAPFNVRVPYTPLAIAVPRTTQQIQSSVHCGKALRLKVSAKSGGHSYGNMGFGGENGHLVVQLDRMYNMTVNPVTKVATVQPGARLGHMATVLYEKYNRAVAHGTCPG
jgi:FAD/FMN-containing dehydrogenase